MATGFLRVDDPREPSGSHNVFYNPALKVASCNLFNTPWITQVTCVQCGRNYTNTHILGGGGPPGRLARRIALEKQSQQIAGSD